MYTRLYLDGKRAPLVRQAEERVRITIDIGLQHQVILALEAQLNEDGSLGFTVSEYQGGGQTEPWRVQGRVPGTFPTSHQEIAPESSSVHSEASTLEPQRERGSVIAAPGYHPKE